MTNLEKLKALVMFLEANPQLQPPEVPVYVFAGKEAVITAAKIPGAKKEYTDSYLNVKVPYGDDAQIEYCIARTEVCTVVETQTVVVPAKEEYTYKKPVKWACHPLLAPSVDAPEIVSK